MIEVGDVKLCEKTERVFIDLNHPTKSRARGFGFMTPKLMYQWFPKYIQTLIPKKDDTNPIRNPQFCKNFNVTSGKRMQNMGRDRISYILRRIETFLGLEPKSLTSHCFRWTGATIIANSGISLLGLKRAGRFLVLKSAEEYLEYLFPAQEDIMNRLLGASVNLTQDTMVSQLTMVSQHSMHSIQTKTDLFIPSTKQSSILCTVWHV